MMMGLHPNLHLFTLFLALCGVYGLEVRQLQNGTATPNLTTKVFETDHFFRDLDGPCQRLLDHLEACPTNALQASKARFATAQLLAECLSRQYGIYFNCSEPFTKLKFLPVEAFPAMYNSKNTLEVWKNADLPELSVNKSCAFPSILPIMRTACAFDYETLNQNDCCSSPKSDQPCGKESFNLLACSIQSLHTYVGCTARDANDTKSCVVETAPRINYVPIGFQVNSDGQECPNPGRTIRDLALVAIADFVIFAIANYEFWQRLRLHCLGRNIKVRTSRFDISPLGFYWSLASEICSEVIIVGVILSRAGYQVDMLKQFVIFAIRPRAAFFNGVLGAFDGGWTHDGITDMIIQTLLSIFGGYLAFFGAVTANHTTDPARPALWRTYMGGGFVASISTTVVWLSFSIMCIIATFCCCGSWKLLKSPLKLLFTVLIFAIVQPLAQLKFIIKKTYRCVRRRRVGEEDYMVLHLRDLNNNLFMVWYYIGLALCLILLVGCWMFWTGFLHLSGELFCPAELGTIDLVIVGFSLLRNIVRKIITFLTTFGQQKEEGQGYEDTLPLQPY